MSWEDKFSTMVKESTAKIDEAKKRLHSFDISRTPAIKNSNFSSVLPPPPFQSTPHARSNQATSLHSNRANGSDDAFFTLHQSHGTSSAALLHSLCEKVERQSQEFDLLESKVATMETELSNQQNEMQRVKERLSQLAQRVENFEHEADGGTNLNEFKNEIRSELNKIKDCIPDTKDENQKAKLDTRISERSGHVEASQVLNSFQTIKTRLDKIESDLSSSQLDIENNNERIEMNVSLISDLKNENMESMNRLCKLQDLSVDEVKHLRSKFYDVQDKIHELETSINDVCLTNEFTSNRKPSSFLGSHIIIKDDDDAVIPRASRSYISISSDEDERSSLTTSSVNLDASDHGDLSFEINELSLDGSNKVRAKSQNSGSFHSSLNSLTGSEDSLSEI